MAVTAPPLPPEFTNQVELSIEVTVGGERLHVQTSVLEAVYNHPDTRALIEKSLRDALMRKILEKWTPVIKVRR